MYNYLGISTIYLVFHSTILWPYVLDRVARGLRRDRLYLDYLEVFCQQERDVIIKIFVPPQWFKEYIWIPRRPVLKSDPTSTIKLRPVSNRGLKTSDSRVPLTRLPNRE